MGPFAYLNGMACNHGIVSMKHQITGHMVIKGLDLYFKEDSGYIEKDWGRSFPKRYIWLQGNLVSPVMGEMKAIIKEGLGGTVCLKVYERSKLIYETCSKNCGIEVEGY